MSVNAVLADEIEEFVTLLTPYTLDTEARMQLRDGVRGAALAHLLGGLADLIEHDAVDTASVTATIRAALAAGAAHQQQRLEHLATAA